MFVMIRYLDPQGISNTFQELDVGPIELPSPLTDPQHVG